MTETHIEIEPEDVDLASFDVVIDIGTDRSIPRPYPDALMTSYDQLTLHPDSYVTSNARILVVCRRVAKVPCWTRLPGVTASAGSG
jgi:hypothetical protein